MDAFFKYIKVPHIKEDFKSTFDLSAKFKYPGPSQAQKNKYFQDEFTFIFQRFYHHLRNNDTLQGKDDRQVQMNLKNKVDQSDLVIEFDSWLEMDSNQFVFTEKTEKPKPIIQHTMHTQFTNTPTSVSIQKQAPVPHVPTVTRAPQPKPTLQNPFNIEKNPPPSQPTRVIQQPVVHPQPAQRQVVHPNSIPYVPAQIKGDDKEKPPKVRFLEKLSEYMECPERAHIIKVELGFITKKGQN